ncbi:TSUP family transporter [Novosphingobium sp. FSY-8]|uniref:Probable membrane transporter protein n=1 Tax=Novosphingobium ovatum TaxID=1908523 RepID=A0ABW9X9J3_9SPHN|nr:sulfite exporter TauE/SafE family protein [Novosphingobium ovatum]NBC35202.1 TSUP family transporter [Novosphingobium ovatum]
MALFQHLDGLHAIAGLLVGLLVGLTGVGGGSLMTPLLVLMFGVNPTTAVGTDLLYASATKMVGSGVHGWRATVDWRIMQRLALGSIPAALFTLLVLSRVGQLSSATQGKMMIGLSVMLVITSATVFFQKKLIAYGMHHHPIRTAQQAALATIALGAVIGLAVSLTSVGAGAIGVTALLMLYPNQPVARIVGTDIAHAVPLTLVAGMGHWIIGDVDGALLANLLIGSVPGVIVGSLISSRAPDRVLRVLLGMVLAVSAWQLYLKASKAVAAKDKPAASAAASAAPATATSR